ncbi:hypothetical protein HWC45_gp19 [Corynebacterium phage Stiles]|uniref:Uncharacterized protein n=1 Tax=Corynebacterium phage Stiles TaxID=2588504 RepID=A0A4Y6EQM7_9CAUD|nr:hypothetical protein HWC45_gp19 [Corynebacterium phage Stiles]QDF20031.1 hypothetical protein SEA_STILES_19 [Corynebacterium phage Stiles]
MTAPEPMIPPDIPRFDSIQDLRQWNADRIRRQMRKPADEAIEKMQRDLRDGLLSRIAGALRGEGLPGFEVVRDAVRDGLLPGIADAVRDVADLPGQYVPVRDAIRDLIFPVTERLDEVEESQLSAEEQLALLEGVRGYGAAYQRWNENLRSAPGNRRRLSLAPHGVAKGVRVEGGGIFIDEPGVWTVHAQVFARGTSFTPGLGSDDITKLFVILREYQPVYKTSTIKEVYGKGGSGPHHIQASFTVVIARAPVLLDFEVFSDRWRYFDGGTALTSFSVVKTDSRVENLGEVTVPDA